MARRWIGRRKSSNPHSTTARAARDVANAVRPAAETTAKVAKEVADKTIAAVKPAVTKAAETTESVARRVKERVQGH